MRGKFLHNHLAGKLESAFIQTGATVDLEWYFQTPSSRGSLDLRVCYSGCIVACEVECGRFRVGRDIDKARALGSQIDALVIVVPNQQVAAEAIRKIRRHSFLEDPSLSPIYCLTFGILAQRLANQSPLKSGANVLETLIHLFSH